MDGLFASVLVAAAASHSVMDRAQLHHLGVSDTVIKRWVADGLVHRIHRGVYAVGRPDLTPDGHRVAAVRALPSTAAVSHGSAAAMWELTNTALFPVHVLIEGSGRRRHTNVRIHRTTTLHPDDVTTLRHIPVTSVARTCLDHAAHVSIARVVTVVEQSLHERRFDLVALLAVLERNPHHPGAAALPHLENEPPDIASLLERAFREFIAAYGLPLPLFNVTAAGHKVDAHWPQWKLVIELKSRKFHLTPKAMEIDAVRDVDLQRVGQRVIQVTWTRLDTASAALYDDITAFANDN